MILRKWLRKTNDAATKNCFEMQKGLKKRNNVFYSLKLISVPFLINHIFFAVSAFILLLLSLIPPISWSNDEANRIEMCKEWNRTISRNRAISEYINCTMNSTVFEFVHKLTFDKYELISNSLVIQEKKMRE